MLRRQSRASGVRGRRLGARCLAPTVLALIAFCAGEALAGDETPEGASAPGVAAEQIADSLPGPDAQAPEQAVPTPSFETVVIGRRAAPTSTVTRLSALDIRARGAATVPEMLELVPGVEINDGPKTGGTLQLRGFDERASLILLDGIPLREAFAGHFDLSSLLAGQVKSVEVDRGVTSVLYGPNSMGGVVNLYSYEDLGERTGEVRLTAGNPYGNRILDKAAELRLAKKSGDWSVVASGAVDRSEGFVVSHDFKSTAQTLEFDEDGDLRAGSDFSKSMLMAKVTYAPRPGLRIAALSHAFFQDRGIPTFSGAHYTRYWRYTAYNTYLGGLVLDYTPEDASAPWQLAGVKAACYVARHDDTIKDYQDDSFSQLTKNPLAWFVASSYRNQSYGLVVTPSWQLSEGNRLDASANINYESSHQRSIPVTADRVNDEWSPWGTFGSTTFSLGLEDKHQLGALRVAAGVGGHGLALVEEEIRNRSYPVSHRVLTAVDGRLFADYELLDGLRLLVAAGHKTRYPTLKELFSNYVGGNPNLDAEQAWMSEAGLDWSWLGRAARASGRLFYNAVRDLIAERFDVYANVVYANVERATTAGAELSTAWFPLSWLQLQAQYTYLFAHDDTEDRELDYRSPHSVGLDARLSTPWGSTFSIQGLYRSGQRSLFFDGVDWRDDRLPQYVLLNAVGEQRIELGGTYAANVFVRLRNILDANYVRGSFAPEPGRQLFAGMDVEF